MNPILNKYILDKKSLLDLYIGKLTGNIKEEIKVSYNNTKYDKVLINNIITTIEPDYIYNLCLHHFLIIYTYENTEEVKNTLLVPVSVTIGKKLVLKYFNTLREIENKAGKVVEKLGYLDWVNKWKGDNPQLANVIDDNLHSSLGCKVIEVLENCDMIKKVLKYDRKQSQYSLKIIENKILPKDNKTVLSIPTKLPMICPPKPYTSSKVGGYLLNDVKFRNELILDKHQYG